MRYLNRHVRAVEDDRRRSLRTSAPQMIASLSPRRPHMTCRSIPPTGNRQRFFPSRPWELEWIDNPQIQSLYLRPPQESSPITRGWDRTRPSSRTRTRPSSPCQKRSIQTEVSTRITFAASSPGDPLQIRITPPQPGQPSGAFTLDHDLQTFLHEPGPGLNTGHLRCPLASFYLRLTI